METGFKPIEYASFHPSIEWRFGETFSLMGLYGSSVLFSKETERFALVQGPGWGFPILQMNLIPGVVMATFLMVLQVVVALLLICVVLIQEPKSTGGGLFSGTGQSLLGTSGKTFWTKFTTGLAVVFFVLCLALAALPNHRSGSSLADDIQRTQEQAAAAAASQTAPKTDAAAPTKAPGAAVPAANAPAAPAQNKAAK